MKRYYKIYVTKTSSSINEIVKGYYYGKDVRATKLYKKLHNDTFYRDMYHSIGTEEISKTEYLKGMNPVFKQLHPKQKEFLQDLLISYTVLSTIKHEEEQLLKELVNADRYSVHDSELLNRLLKTYGKRI
jgi:hypothetical protein